MPFRATRGDAPHLLEPKEVREIKERVKGAEGVKGDCFKNGV